MSDTIRDVVIRIGIAHGDMKLPAPDVSALKSAAAAQSKAVDETSKKVLAARKAEEKASRDAAKSEAAARKEAADLTTKGADAQQKASESAIKAVGGVMQAVKGAAFAFAGTQENAAGMVQVIATAQGAFDIVKGGFETVKGLSEGFKAARTAATAMSAANAVTATTNTAVAGSSVAAAGGVGTLSAAMVVFRASLGPEILLLTAITAAVMALFRETETAAEANEKYAKSYKGLTEAARQNLKTSTEQLGLEYAIADAREAAGEGKQVEFAGAYNALLDRRKDTLAEIARLNEQGFLRGNTERLKDLSAQLVQIEEAKLAVQEQSKRSREQEVTTAKQLADESYRDLEASKAKVAEEEKRQRSLAASLGMLTKSEFRQLTKLRDAAASGATLSDRKLSRLAELGGAGAAGFVEQQRAARGETRGGAGFFDPLRTPEQVAATGGASSKDFLAGLRSQVDSQKEIAAESVRVLNEAQEELRKLSAQQLEAQQSLRDEIKEARKQQAIFNAGFRLQGK